MKSEFEWCVVPKFYILFIKLTFEFFVIFQNIDISRYPPVITNSSASDHIKNI